VLKKLRISIFNQTYALGYEVIVWNVLVKLHGQILNYRVRSKVLIKKKKYYNWEAYKNIGGELRNFK
jgi:nicotinamide mononucleotide adenylyltransferase